MTTSATPRRSARRWPRWRTRASRRGNEGETSMSKPVLGKSILSVLVALLAVASASAGAQTGDIKDRTIKMPVVNAIDHPQGIGAKKFAELIEQKSDGKIKIKVYPDGTLGREQQVASAMQGNTIEVSMMAPAQLVGNYKEFLVLDLPFAFANEREADLVLDGPFGKKLLDVMPAKGQVRLASMEPGSRE